MPVDTTLIAPVSFDAERRVDQDLPCVACDYNLRTRHEDAACPECGAAVASSVRAWLLAGHSVKYLNRLWHALLCFAVGMLLWNGLLVLVAFNFSVSVIVAVMLLIPASIFVICGAWLGLGPDADQRERLRIGVMLRRLARWGVLLGPVLFFVVKYVHDAYAISYLSRLVMFPVFYLMPASVMLGMLYLALIARRLAGRALRWTQITFAALGLLTICSLLLTDTVSTLYVFYSSMQVTMDAFHQLMITLRVTLHWALLAVSFGLVEV